MEEVFLALAKDAPWIALSAFLLWRNFSREDRILDAYKSGAESQNGMAAAIESLERSMGSVQQSLSRVEAQIDVLRRQP